MSSGRTARKPSWIKRTVLIVGFWGSVCGMGLLVGMSPRPLLLALLIGAASITIWLVSDSIGLAEPTDWQITQEVVSRPRGADARVVTLERLIADIHNSAESRLRLHHLFSTLADERLRSLRGIDRQSDPAGARLALGPDLDDFISSPNPGHTDLTVARMSMILNRIESL